MTEIISLVADQLANNLAPATAQSSPTYNETIVFLLAFVGGNITAGDKYQAIGAFHTGNTLVATIASKLSSRAPSISDVAEMWMVLFVMMAALIIWATQQPLLEGIVLGAAVAGFTGGVATGSGIQLALRIPRAVAEQSGDNPFSDVLQRREQYFVVSWPSPA